MLAFLIKRFYMAIFGQIKSLAPLFSKTEELDYLLGQIQALFQSDSLLKIQSLTTQQNFQTPLKYGMFSIAHCYQLKEEKEGFFESHLKYIDIQVVVEGFERFLIAPKDRFKLITPYDETKDLAIYHPAGELSQIFLQEKEMCILFPEDVHTTGIGKENELENIVKKVVFKVPYSFIKHRL